MSVLGNILADYHGTEQADARTTLASVTQAIKRALVSRERSKRSIGELLNAVVASDILIAASATIDSMERDWSDDARGTALSKYIKAVGISRADASVWRKYADGEQAREQAGISKPAADSAYRDIVAGTSIDTIADMLKATFGSDAEVADGEELPAMTRKNVGAAAQAAGIGTDNAGNNTNNASDVAESELQTTPAQQRTQAVNTIVELHADGVTLTLTEIHKLETLIKEIVTLKKVA